VTQTATATSTPGDPTATAVPPTLTATSTPGDPGDPGSTPTPLAHELPNTGATGSGGGHSSTWNLLGFALAFLLFVLAGLTRAEFVKIRRK
jgi:hypothetical protein